MEEGEEGQEAQELSIYGRTIVLDYTVWFTWTGSHGGVDTQGQKKGRRTGPLEGVCGADIRPSVFLILEVQS